MLVFLIAFVVFKLCLAATAQQCVEGDIRMTNATAINRDAYYFAGGLQICVNNKWATVCQSGWEDHDATVACGQLGMVYTGCKLSFGILYTFFVTVFYFPIRNQKLLFIYRETM